MKYAMLPTPWEETLQALDAAGHERAPLEDAEVLIFNGGPDDFPRPCHRAWAWCRSPSLGWTIC